VIAYDLVPAALDAAVRLGAERADSAAQAAAVGDLVITMLPSSANVEAVYLGDHGILESVPTGRLCSANAGSGFSMRRYRAGSVVRRQGHWRSWSAALLAISKRRVRRWRRWVPTSSISVLSAPAKSPSCATI